MRLGHLDNGHLSIMKYVITEIFVGTTGGFVFNPANGIEVFDHYVSALRWLVKERVIALRIDLNVTYMQEHSVSEYGRIIIGHLKEVSENGITHFYLSRINENGFH